MPIILRQTVGVLEHLIALFGSDTNSNFAGFPAGTTTRPLVLLELHKTRCSAYCHTTEYHHQRAQSTAQLLTLTLSFQDQVMAKDQNETVLRLNKAVAFITTITLFYLPASFVSVSILLDFCLHCSPLLIGAIGGCVSDSFDIMLMWLFSFTLLDLFWNELFRLK
jgi:hypothetical protein